MTSAPTTHRPRRSHPASRRVGILSGTGPHGRGLARRFALAGHEVLLGSRDAERAVTVARKLVDRVPAGRGGSVTGTTNRRAATQADVVIVAAAWSGCTELLEGLRADLAGKVVVSCVNPLGFDEQGAYVVPTSAGSAAEHIAALLPHSMVVAAMHHLSAALLLDPAGGVHGEDVLVAGDDGDANAVVRELCRSLTGRFGLDAGPLRLARYLEPFTAVLISVNRRSGTQSGLVLTNAAAGRHGAEPAVPLTLADSG